MLYDGIDPKLAQAGYENLIEPFGWFATYMALADHKPKDVSKVKKMNLYEAFAVLALMKNQGELRENLSKLQK